MTNDYDGDLKGEREIQESPVGKPGCSQLWHNCGPGPRHLPLGFASSFRFRVVAYTCMVYVLRVAIDIRYFRRSNTLQPGSHLAVNSAGITSNALNASASFRCQYSPSQ